MGDGGSVPHPLYLDVALDRFDYHFAVKIPGFYPELVAREFPKIEAQPDNHRKLGMDTGKIPGNDRIKRTNNSKLPGVFLGKIAKGKKFYLHRIQKILFIFILV
jgi:hypothetical protein